MTFTGLASAVASATVPQSLVRRFAASLPGLGLCLAGSVAWAMAMAGSAAADLAFSGWQSPESIMRVAAVFGAGGALAFPIAFTAAGLLRSGRFESRFAAALLAFTIATSGCTALVYALDYRHAYSEWHGDPLSAQWAVEFAYTVAGALGQFALSGIRLYFPIGFAGLLGVSAWFARRGA
jgi:hypothetical protein